jgi:hypothetical protein
MKTSQAGNEHASLTRRSRAAAALALALGVASIPFACRRSDEVLRGQSGSEAPAGTGGSENASDESPPCPCGAGGIFLRVTVLDSSGALRTLRVEQVIHGSTDRAVGEELRVEDSGQLPCFVGSSPVADGQLALAVFTPSDEPSCDASDCAAVDGSVRLAPWADDLLFAQTPRGDIRVPASELDGLWSDDVEACIERHRDVWRLLDSSSSDASSGSSRDAR